MTKQERRVFTEEFKREAVCLLETSGRTIAQIAEDLAIGRAVGPAVELAAITAYLPFVGIPLTAYVAGAEASYTHQAIDSNGGLRNPVTLHCQALKH